MISVTLRLIDVEQYKRKVKQEPDYFAAYEPEVIVNYPLDAYDDQVKS